MKMVSFYHRETGLLHDIQLTSSDDKNVALNTPDDHVAIDGHHDRLSKRVDIETGRVVDYQPPAPSVDHDWDETTKRWRLNAAVATQLAARAAASAQISSLEIKQARAVREHALGYDGARERLAALDQQIIELRAAALPTEDG